MDIEKVIEKNTAKYDEKLKKKGVMAQGIMNKATSNAKYVNPYAKKPVGNGNSNNSNSDPKPTPKVKNNDKVSTGGSIASKARMVKDFNDLWFF